MNLRLFIAVTVPPVARTEMTRVQQELRPLAAPADVRWVKPEQFHLTLKFLGDVPANSVDAAKNALAGACAGIAPFLLRAKGIGFFPDERAPRVIWVGIENEDHLTELQKRIAESFRPFIEKPGEDQFHAHVTLGRFQKFRRHKAEKLQLRAQLYSNHRFGKWQVQQIDLMQSELSPAGAYHRLLSSVHLAK